MRWLRLYTPSATRTGLVEPTLVDEADIAASRECDETRSHLDSKSTEIIDGTQP
jgi:hypothetical protein